MTTAVRLAVVGAGGRGSAYAAWALAHPALARVVAVVEPRDAARERLGDQHGIPAEHRFRDWSELLAAGRIADAVLICTQDREHRAPVVAFADEGWHILLEKPIAVTEQDCREIAEHVRRSKAVFAVCHVLRYTPYTQAVKAVVDSGRLGDLVTIQHLEPVGYWHYAHAYVRGNWRREADSSPMLLAKSSHDLDWIRHVVGKPIAAVHSFGGLSHYTAENRPQGAADRCLDCKVEPDCAFSAPRLYRRRLGLRTWPVHHLIDGWDPADLEKALREGNYGRCVYDMDNDVVDNQVVNLRFSDGTTGTFTVVGFGEVGHRRTRIYGTKGSLEGDGESITVFDHLTETSEHIQPVVTGDSTAGGGHGGGDDGLMAAFVAAVAGDPDALGCDVDEALESHFAVFAAERSRHEEITVTVAR